MPNLAKRLAGFYIQNNPADWIAQCDIGHVPADGLTAIISLPIGIGWVYLYTNMQTETRAAIRFSTTALRAISGIILAITALSLIHSS